MANTGAAGSTRHAARAARLQQPHPAGSRGIAGSPTRIRHGAATGRPVWPGRLQLIERLRSGQAGAPVEPRIGPTASTSMTRRLPSRTWPCCPPSRPCTSAATIRHCHCTSCTPTWRAWRARPRRIAPAPANVGSKTQQRAAARQRPAPAMAGLAARLCGAAGRRRARLSPGRRAVSTGAPLINVTGKRMHGSFPIRIMARDEPDTGGSFHHEPAPYAHRSHRRRHPRRSLSLLCRAGISGVRCTATTR